MFEYKLVNSLATGFICGDVNKTEIESEFKKLGAEGWELVPSLTSNQAYGATKEILFIFKRKI